MQKELPKKWKMVKLGEIVNVDKGKKLATVESHSEDCQPYIGIDNLRTNQYTNFTKEKDGLSCIETDLLIVWDGANAGTIGYGLKGYVGSTIARLRPSERTTTFYLGHFLKSKFQQFNIQTHGAAIPHLSKSQLLNTLVPLSPLSTQHSIVEILEEADNLRKLRQQADDKMKNLIPSLFVQMFGDPVRNPNGWEVIYLGDVCHSIKDGPHVSPTYQEQGIPFISVQNIQPGRWILDKLKYISSKDHEVYCKKCKPEKGDVLYSKGGSTGMAKFVDLDYEFSIWVHLALLKINCTLIDGRFLEAILNSPYCYQQSQSLTGGIANRDLVLKNMKKVLIYLPPLPLQQEFAKCVEDIEAEKARQAESRKKLDELFNSLMQRAFIGELVA